MILIICLNFGKYNLKLISSAEMWTASQVLTLEWTYALNSMEPLFRRGMVTSLTPPWRLCALLCSVFTLESAQQSATYRMVNNSYLSPPNGKAVATKQQTAGFRPLNMSWHVWFLSLLGIWLKKSQNFFTVTFNLVVRTFESLLSLLH